jgi:hypothetical protein
MIQKMIHEALVTVKIPNCGDEKFKFLPRGCIDSIASLDNIRAYIQPEFCTGWPPAEMDKYASKVHEKAQKLFIAVAKKNWTFHFIKAALREGYTDLQMETRFTTSSDFDVEGGLRDKVRKELKMHLAEPIKPGEFDGTLSRMRLPFTCASRRSAPPGKTSAVFTWDVTLHPDYWANSKDGLDFILLVLDQHPYEGDEGDAVAGFWSKHLEDLEYWMLFPKGTVIDEDMYKECYHE